MATNPKITSDSAAGEKRPLSLNGKQRKDGDNDAKAKKVKRESDIFASYIATSSKSSEDHVNIEKRKLEIEEKRLQIGIDQASRAMALDHETLYQARGNSILILTFVIFISRKSFEGNQFEAST